MSKVVDEVLQSGKYHVYPEYKDSGVEWLGDMPSHWLTSKLRYMFTFGKGLAITKENLRDEGIPCVNYGEVHSKYGFEVDPTKHPLRCVEEDYLKTSSSSVLNIGDFVFADTSEDIDGSGNFTQLTSDVVTFAGYHTIIVRPIDKSSHRFFAYLFDSKEFRTAIRHAVKGVKVFSITQAILRGADIWLPSQDERQRIAAFLDYETARIDRLIAQQQRLIELLKEKRQAVISHAVTKGLNPNAPMKDSGIEWLGQVPEHWVVTYNKYLVQLTPKKSQITLDREQLCSFIPMEKLKQDTLILDEQRVIGDVFDGYTYFEDEDILLAKVTPCFENKNSVVARGLINGVGFGSTEIFVLRCNSQINNDFMYYRLQEGCFMDTATAAMTGAGGLKRVPSDVILNYKIALPPIEEQLAIVKALKNQLDACDKLIERAFSAIALMQERRIALISAAVTGKIDLRGWTQPAEEVAA